jgi:hypothetical protein
MNDSSREAEPLAQLDDREGGLVPAARVGLVEQPDGQETRLAQRTRVTHMIQ